MYSCHIHVTPSDIQSHSGSVQLFGSSINCTCFCPLRHHKGSVGASTVIIASGSITLVGEALVRISGESVQSQAGAVNPCDLSADLESHASVKITPLSSSSRVDTLADDSDQSPVHTGARSPTVTTKSSSTLGVTRGRDRVKSVHSGTTSFRGKKSNSTRESPIPSDQTSEREHSPEPLDTLYPEEEGPLPAGQSFQDPYDSGSLDSGLRRDLPDVELRSSPKIFHIRQSRKLYTTTPHHHHDELRRVLHTTTPHHHHDELRRVCVDNSLDWRNRQELHEASSYRHRSRSPPRRSSYGRDRSDGGERFHFQRKGIALLIFPVLLVDITLGGSTIRLLQNATSLILPC